MFVFPEVFQCFKCHKNEAKHDKRNFKIGLTVSLDFKMTYYYWENQLKTL